MKTIKRLFVIYILSLIIASAVLFINRDIVVSGWDDKLFEVAFLSLPVFVVLLLLYTISKILLKTSRAIQNKNKRPSRPEDLNKL
ncbi:hypothetical protein [Flavobacterium sp. MK4S-17]|uniref:hypothetical protein n=1 Tax=Flavobacterium sp. MK4S-17 TaxID=2543737 RepID=UPI00135BBAE7|nr:hypothetical protein [Flavobacterium sp. MK4S-17]